MIFRLPFITISIAFMTILASCKTVELPLGSVMVGRPHTMGSQFGVRLTAGGADEPKVQGIVDEVKDTEGKTINPLISDSSGDGKVPMGVIEFGIGFLKRVELDVSSHRGASAMYDFYRDERWTSSISVSRSTFAIDQGSVQQSANSQSGNSEGKSSDDSSFTSIDHIAGKCSNTNFTLLGSTRFGDQVWAQFSLYGGAGINQIWAEVSDEQTNDKKTKSQWAPSALAGIQAKLAVFELSIESAGIRIHERNNRDKWVPLFLATLTLRFDIFGDDKSK